MLRCMLSRAGASGSNSLEIHDPTFRKTPYRYHSLSGKVEEVEKWKK